MLHKTSKLCNIITLFTVLAEIRLPEKVPQRGRPKGSGQTVVGTPRKRAPGRRKRTAAAPNGLNPQV